MKLNVQVEMPKSAKHDDRPRGRRILGLGQLIEIIEGRTLNPAIKQDVIKEVSQYPEGSLDFAWGNLENIINGVIAKHGGKDAIEHAPMPTWVLEKTDMETLPELQPRPVIKPEEFTPPPPTAQKEPPRPMTFTEKYGKEALAKMVANNSTQTLGEK